MVDSFIQFVASLGRRTLSICEAFGRATLMLLGLCYQSLNRRRTFLYSSNSFTP